MRCSGLMIILEPKSLLMHRISLTERKAKMSSPLLCYVPRDRPGVIMGARLLAWWLEIHDRGANWYIQRGPCNGAALTPL